MELIYFILGLLTAAVLYCVYLLHRVYKSHAEVVAHNQTVLNHSAIEYSNMRDEVKELESYIKAVKESLENDSYQSVVELRKEMELTSKLAMEVGNNLTTHVRNIDKGMEKVYSNIQTLNTRVNGLSQDPNFLQRYS